MSEPKEAAKGPLSRWSERKLAARRGEALDEAPAPAGETLSPAESAPPAEPTAESEMPELPSLDELDFQSDYTGFLNKNVPEGLRRAALRKLWTSDPVLANLDGLNDYDDDYNAIGQFISLVQSSYQAGRGYVDEAEKKLAQVKEAVSGGAADSPAAPAQSGQGTNDKAMSDSDTAPPEPADALQQSADVMGEDAEAEPAEESGK